MSFNVKYAYTWHILIYFEGEEISYLYVAFVCVMVCLHSRDIKFCIFYHYDRKTKIRLVFGFLLYYTTNFKIKTA